MQGWNENTQRRFGRVPTGFTLIEVMICMAIIGILMAVALPSYSSYVMKTRRADGQLAILKAVQSMERCKATNYAYTGCALSDSDATSPEGYYTLTLEDLTARTYTVVATAAADGPQAADTDCETMGINHQDVKTPTDASLGCWPN